MVQLLCAQPSPTTSLLAHLTSSQFTHCPCRAGFALPLHEGGGNRYHSQVSAPAFGGASWTTNTCCPKPAMLTTQPDVTGASRSHLLSRLEQCWPESTGTPHLGVPAMHRQAAPSTPKLKRHSWGPQRRTRLQTTAQLSFERHRDPKSYGWTCSVQIAARAHNTDSPIPKLQEPLCFLPAAQPGNRLHSHFLSCTTEAPGSG